MCSIGRLAVELARIEAQMRIDSLVPSNTVWTAAAGTVLGVIDPATWHIAVAVAL